MGFYSVVRPCVVGKLHYATVPAQPIEVDDEVAAPLVESGALSPYRPGMFVAPKLSPIGWSEPSAPAEDGPYAVAYPPNTSAESLASAVKTTFLEDSPAEVQPEKRPRSSRRPKA